MNKKILLIVVALMVYTVGTSLTFGYDQKYSRCFGAEDEMTCSNRAFVAATIWPVYWVYHSGTILFEPERGE